MKKTGSLITSILLIILFITACSTPEKSPEAVPSSEGSIVCEVFYRAESGMGLEAAPLITLSDDMDQKVHQFEKMAFQVQHQADEYEGRALSIAVIDLENGKEITRQLYQFDPINPVENQFIGGHGFSGLNYVYLPDSSAEMQYFCSSK